jgi:hypothetical protein
MTFRESEWGNGPGGLVYVTALALQRERDELEQEPEGRTRDYFYHRPRPFSRDKRVLEYIYFFYLFPFNGTICPDTFSNRCVNSVNDI